MKKSLVLVAVLLTMMASTASAQYYLIDTSKLNSTYSELIEKPNAIERQKAFFDAFPSNWEEFNSTYQYCNKKGYDMTMYKAAQKQIDALGKKVTLLPDSVYCKKLVNIAIGGVWDADAPNYFKGLLHDVMKQRMDGMFKEVSKLKKGYQMQFWQFYWSNIVKSKPFEEEYQQLKTIAEKKYPKEVKVMNIAFEYFYDGIGE